MAFNQVSHGFTVLVQFQSRAQPLRHEEADRPCQLLAETHSETLLQGSVKGRAQRESTIREHVLVYISNK